MVCAFVEDHEILFVIEQNLDAQMRTLLINELEINPDKLIRVLNYDGMPITAAHINKESTNYMQKENKRSKDFSFEMNAS